MTRKSEIGWLVFALIDQIFLFVVETPTLLVMVHFVDKLAELDFSWNRSKTFETELIFNKYWHTIWLTYWIELSHPEKMAENQAFLSKNTVRSKRNSFSKSKSIVSFKTRWFDFLLDWRFVRLCTLAGDSLFERPITTWYRLSILANNFCSSYSFLTIVV